MSLFRVDPKHPFVGPHQGEIISKAGPPPVEADAAVVLAHGRGASAQSMLMFAEEFNLDNLSYFAPQAHRSSWYPYSFTAAIEDNEPGISSGLQAIQSILNDLLNEGLSNDQIVILGFSQGACLTLEFAARHPRRYGGIIGLSGGLLGPEVQRELYTGDLKKTPVFIGCGDKDSHIPEERVHETAEVLDELNGEVTKKIYTGMGHSVNKDEIEHVSEILDRL